MKIYKTYKIPLCICLFLSGALWAGLLAEKKQVVQKQFLSDSDISDQQDLFERGPRGPRGPMGVPGKPGPLSGITGATGAAGLNGKTILSGAKYR